MKKTVVEIQGYEKESAALKQKGGGQNKVGDKEKVPLMKRIAKELAVDVVSDSAGSGETMTAGGNQSLACFTEALMTPDTVTHENLGIQSLNVS